MKSRQVEPSWRLRDRGTSNKDIHKEEHKEILVQAHYSILRGIGSKVKRRMSVENYNIKLVSQLWIGIRNCFFLSNESAVQALKDEIQYWDVEKAGSWNQFTDGLQRLYSRLDIAAGARSFTPSDKLHKLRNVLCKLDSEKEKAICNQVKIMVDSDQAGTTSLACYEKCFTFADKRMKLLIITWYLSCRPFR